MVKASRQLTSFVQMTVLQQTIWFIKWIAKLLGVHSRRAVVFRMAVVNVSTNALISFSTSGSKIWPKTSTTTKRFNAFNQWIIGRWNQLLQKQTRDTPFL